MTNEEKRKGRGEVAAPLGFPSTSPLARAGREMGWDGMGGDGKGWDAMGCDGRWEMVVYWNPSCYTHALTYLYVMDAFRALT